MRRRSFVPLALAACGSLGVAAGVAGPAGAATPAVTVTTTAAIQYATNINTAGQVLGYTYTGDHLNILCSIYGKVGCTYVENAKVLNGTTVSTLLRTAVRGADAIAQNDAGTVLTESLQADGRHPVAWVGSGTTKTAVQLDSLGQFAQADALNASGQAVSTYVVSGFVHAEIASGYSATKAPTLTQIGVIGSATDQDAVPEQASATAINASGVVIGNGNGPSGTGPFTPWIFQNGKLSWLPLPAPWTTGDAIEINSSGWVLGVVTHPPAPTAPGATPSVQHLALWRGGTFTDLGTLGGDLVSPGSFTNQHNMNDAGQIIGTSTAGADSLDASGFLWQNGVMTRLPAPAGYEFWPTAINASGDIAGGLAEGGSGGTLIPALLRKGVVTDLQKASGTTGLVEDLNNSDTVLGHGVPNTVIWHVAAS